MSEKLTPPVLREIEHALGASNAACFDELNRIAKCLKSGYAIISREDRERATGPQSARDLAALTAPAPVGELPKASVLQHIIDPYVTGRFEVVDLALPAPLLTELMTLANHKAISIYYLAAIYQQGRSDALAQAAPRTTTRGRKELTDEQREADAADAGRDGACA